MSLLSDFNKKAFELTDNFVKNVQDAQIKKDQLKTGALAVSAAKPKQESLVNTIKKSETPKDLRRNVASKVTPYIETVKNDFGNWNPPVGLDLKKPDKWFTDLPEAEQSAVIKQFGEREIYKDQINKIYQDAYRKRQIIVQSQARDLREDYIEPSGWSGTFKSLGEGILESVTSLQRGLGELTELTGESLSSEKLQKVGVNIALDAQKRLARNPEWKAPENPSWSDPAMYSRLVGNAIPSIAGGLGVGFAAKANKLVQALSLFGFTSTIESGSAIAEAKDSGLGLDEQKKVASTVGIINGILEQIPIMNFLNKSAAGKQVTKNIVNKILSGFIKQGSMEGSTEFIQQLVTNATLSEFVENKKLFDGALESFVVGFLIGGLLGGGQKVYSSPLFKDGLKRIKEDTRGSVPVGFGLLGSEGNRKVSGLSQGVVAKAVSNNLIESIDDLPTYETINIENESKAVEDLIQNDIKKAERIAYGLEDSVGVKSTSVFVGLEKYANETGNVDMIMKLAKSPLNQEASSAAQTLRILKERNPESPVDAIRDLSNVRKKVAESRSKKGIKVEIKNIKEQIKVQIRKASPKVETWQSFIESIQC